MADYNIHVFEKHAREYDRWFETHIYAYESEVLASEAFSRGVAKGWRWALAQDALLLELASKSGWNRHKQWHRSHGNEVSRFAQQEQKRSHLRCIVRFCR